MRSRAAPKNVVSAEVHQLVDHLTQSSQKGVGARLRPQDVDIALMALKAGVGMMAAPKIKLTPRTFQIELLDRHGWPEQVLAVVRDETIARAAFDEAIKQQPGRKIRLRLGGRVVAEA
jgi:hypothetical protein